MTDDPREQAAFLVALDDFRACRFDRAEAGFRALVAADERRALYHSYLGCTLRNLGSIEEAARSYESALALNPEYVEPLFFLARIRESQGRLEEAASAYERVLRLRPQPAPSTIGYKAYLHLGLLLERLERWQDAAAVYRARTDLSPSDGEAWFRQGLVLERINQLTEAEACYTKAAQYRSHDVQTWLSLADLRHRRQDVAGTAEALSRALALSPDRRDVRLRLVESLYAAGRSAEALAHVRELQTGGADELPWSLLMEVVQAFIRVPPRPLPEEKKWEYFHYNPEKVLALLTAALTVREPFPYTPRVFLTTGLVSWDKSMGFLDDERFMECARKYDHLRMMVNWEWNLHVVQWAANQALQVPGDFVELGVYRGYTTAVTAENIHFAQQPRRWLLYETFAGVPEDQRTDGWPHAYSDANSDAWHREVVDLFAAYDNIEVIRGRVPEVFDQRCPEQIAFLHMDLNNARAEIGALDALYDRLSPGAVVVFDDYGWYNSREQFDEENAWMRRRRLAILELPTGQGLFVKAPR